MQQQLFVELNGKTIRRGKVENGGFWTTLDENERLTIVIAPKLECNCSVSR